MMSPARFSVSDGPWSLLADTSEHVMSEVTTVHWPSSAAAAAGLLNRPGAVIVAGGTLELPRWQRAGPPAEVICVARIPGLAEISATRCGAAASLGQLAAAPCLPGALRQAAGSVGGPALRAAATVGGNVAGHSPGCLITVLLALGASVGLAGPPGQAASLPLADWCDQAARSRGTVLTGFWWPRATRSAFAKVATRAAGGTVLMTAAAASTHDDSGGPVTRLAVGGQGLRSRAWQADGAHVLPLSGDGPVVRLADGATVPDLPYRQELATVLAERVLRVVTA
jgi:CO/xanthine dehydrogenase FAD-binding subunit